MLYVILLMFSWSCAFFISYWDSPPDAVRFLGGWWSPSQLLPSPSYHENAPYENSELFYLCNIFKIEGGLLPIKRRICNKIQRARTLCREQDGILSGVEILLVASSPCGALRHRTSASKNLFFWEKEGGPVAYFVQFMTRQQMDEGARVV